MSEFKFAIGDQVYKHTGDYNFPGEIRSLCKTRSGAIRYVVEATGEGYAGMLHIFSESQLEFLIP